MGDIDVCVLGLGYIGLPTASIFATKGKRVVGVDVVERVVATINDGRIHIEEPDLDVLVKAATQSGNLRAALEPVPAECYIITVPTPVRHDADTKEPDLSFVEDATRSLAPVIEEGALVILESTSPVGTTEQVREWLIDELDALGRCIAIDDLDFAYCPERILPGQMIQELVGNDRIAGGLTASAAARATALYHVFCTGEIFETDARTAEMAKLTENASRDVAIAFANELANICEHLGIDVWELIRLANRHPRVNILSPGPGVGGHCIAVDPWFIISAAPHVAHLMRTAREVNDARPADIVTQVHRDAKRLGVRRVACLGLAFKANIDDLRESPALQIACQLAASEALDVVVSEPHVDKLPDALAGRTHLLPADQAVQESDIVLLLVDHRQFASLAPEALAGKHLIDTRGFFRRVWLHVDSGR